MSKSMPIEGMKSRQLAPLQQIFALQTEGQGTRLRVSCARERSKALKDLLGIVDAKDPYTYGHSLRVTQVALMIGKSMGFKASRLRYLYEAACLHDLGKTSIPDTILNKTGRLDKDEMLCMQQHSQIGHKLLADHPLFHGVSKIVLAHHERWDGLGYPFGLKEQQIPLEARVIAVADAFDAMTSDRPYRKGLCHSFSIKEIESHSGDQFDPMCVDHFCRIADRILESTPCQSCSFIFEEDHDALMHSKKV